MTSRLPKLIAFDLDYTLWGFWIDTHVYPPLKRDPSTGKITDNQRKPRTIDFYQDVPQILHRLQAAGVTIAACSRTDTPQLAREALDLILIPPRPGSDDSANPIPAIKFFDQLEIYPSSKIRHFKKLHEKTEIPFEEMLFFDDEWRNQEVEDLGVTFTFVPNGLNDRILEKGLQEWRKRHPVQVNDDAVGADGILIS